jgi:single-strand DNA-binding protein
MSNSVNVLMVIGNLTRDPEVRHTSSGTQVTEFGVAMNRKFKSGDELREDTTFVDAKVWGQEGVIPFLKKGKQVFLRGELRQDKWEDKESGSKRSKHFLHVFEISLLGSREESERTKEEPAPAPEQGQADNDPTDVF